ncbi:hypothetical protein ACFQRB_08915 [Halobaculum litoreum]|uniref:Archaeal glycosylation protein B peripheral domain-containing protein n=1 Tax=Halobaculum litoreum TaxID=3031998 RepID=A0ABD5XN24_9EURY
MKTFEKVPGATIEGSGAEPNETVTATVQMRVPNGGTGGNASTFTYTQETTADADGTFEPPSRTRRPTTTSTAPRTGTPT